MIARLRTKFIRLCCAIGWHRHGVLEDSVGKRYCLTCGAANFKPWLRGAR